VNHRSRRAHFARRRAGDFERTVQCQGDWIRREKHAMSTAKMMVSPLDEVRVLIDQGKLKQALEVIAGCGQRSGSLENAKAVCLMRSGNPQKALEILGRLIFREGGVIVTTETPVVYQTNYITGLLMVGNVGSAVEMLGRLEDDQHPAVPLLRQAVMRWRKQLGIAWRVLCHLGIYPTKSVEVGDAPGSMN
jgi:hypothetical protein